MNHLTTAVDSIFDTAPARVRGERRKALRKAKPRKESTRLLTDAPVVVEASTLVWALHLSEGVTVYALAKADLPRPGALAAAGLSHATPTLISVPTGGRRHAAAKSQTDSVKNFKENSQ